MESKEREYESMSTMEDREELLSSTEVEDSLMGDEEKGQWRSRSHSSPQEIRRKRDAVKSHRWIIGTILQLVIVAMLGLLLFRQQEVKETPPETPQVGGDFNGKGPTIDTTIIKFNADARFVPSNASAFFEDEVLEEWKTMFPTGTGWGTESPEFSTTTMTHQLHCLFMMSRIYAGFEYNARDKIPHDYDIHFRHCIDYLRQGILCAADLATEPHKPTDPDDLGPLDGSWAGLHVCKDYSQVTGYLEQEIKQGARIVLPVDD